MVYRLFNEFVQTFLGDRKDFLTGSGEVVLTPEALDECIDIFIHNPNEDKNLNFSEKYNLQFRDASHNAKIIMAHAVWLYVHPHKGMTAKGKQDAVNFCLLKMQEYKTRDDIYLDKEGIADGGSGYNLRKYENLAFLLFLFRWLKNSQAIIDTESVRKAIIAASLFGVYGQEKELKEAFSSDNISAIRNDLQIIAPNKITARHIGIYNFLLNLCKPDYYARILSYNQKQQIALKLFNNSYVDDENIEVGTMNDDDKIYYVTKHFKSVYPDLDSEYPLRDSRIKTLWENETTDEVGNQPTTANLNYWLFQCNPNVYDIVSALKNATSTQWRVAKHAKDMRIGDKVILWVTGEKAGCYALGEIISEIIRDVRDTEDREFYKDSSYDVTYDRVRILITHNFAETPLLKPIIQADEELKGLKAGFQGTNFRATKKEYNAMVRLAEEIGGANHDINYWLFSPGDNAKMWDEFYSQGYMAIGWVDLGDLSQYATLQEIERKLQSIAETDDSKKHDSLANWQFKTEMKPGDIVIVKKGRKILIGYGEVSSEYYFDPSLVHYQKCRKVDWKLKGEWQTDVVMVTKTLTNITDYPTEHPDYKYYYQRLLAIMGVSSNQYISLSEADNIWVDNNNNLNQILYGPPGTGKTYRSIELAVQIADPDFIASIGKNSDRSQITKRYRELVDQGRIVFTAFHQSMSYEDFIEGIKPVTSETGENSLSYEVVPGIFKRICSKAAISDSNFDQVFDKLIQDLADFEEPLSLKTVSGKTFGILPNTNGNLSLYTGPTLQKNGSLTRDRIGDQFLEKDVPVFFKGYRQGVIEYLKKEYHLSDKGRGCNGRFVLIIDEINRGNVSQIFGELITLIEPDKRAGNSEALEITLPYSKEKFSVPSNLYIIGTMNTADRSVEALDTALRRRFSFQEIVPEYELLANKRYKDIELKEILETLNKRIEGLLDRDHAIGHSYFLCVINGETDLKTVFFSEIIPLLQEYFYGNYGRLELVLGSGFVKSFDIRQTDYAIPSANNEEYSDTTRYAIVKANQQNDDEFYQALRILLNKSDELS